MFPYVMAGGIGSRLWPLSTQARPKPFLSLTSRHSMLQETLLRLEGAGCGKSSVIGNKAHRGLIVDHSAGMPLEKIILEDEGRGTTFAVAVAALNALERDPEALIFVLPCDHYIQNATKLHEAIQVAVPFAASGKLVVFGVEPEGPSSAYGYIEGDDNNKVLSFKEKPDRETSQSYIEEGRYLWNAGMFLFPARRILDDIKTFVPEIFEAAEASWKAAEHEGGFISLKAARNCSSLSIDYSVLEKADDIAVVSLETRWSDLGSWQSLLKHIGRRIISVNR